MTPTRAATWADRHGCGPAFLNQLYARTFTKGEDPTNLDVLRTCAQPAGLNAAALEAGLTEPETKDRLRQMTDAAWQLGVRGVPTVQVAGELFFGDDQLEAAADARRRNVA